MSDFVFTAYDMALLYNCKLLVKSVKDVLASDFSKAADVIKNVLKDVVVVPSALNDLAVEQEFCYIPNCVSGCYYSCSDYKIFFGYCPELLYEKTVSIKNPIENYLISVAINKKYVNFNALNDVDFCVGLNDIVYFPIKNYQLVLNSGDYEACDSGAPSVPPACTFCASYSAPLEHNLDVCHSLVVTGKMLDIIYGCCGSIIEKLNSVVCNHVFSVGEDFYYENLKCGCFINIDDKSNCLYYGLSPNVFYESVISPESAIISDYFSSVAIVKECFNFGSSSPLIKNSAEFNGSWCYIPICRKLLCCENFRELYINRVVEIIKNGLKTVNNKVD